MDNSDDELISAALNYYYRFLYNSCVAMSAKTFRLPSGRELTENEIKQVWARKDSVEDLIKRRANNVSSN